MNNEEAWVELFERHEILQGIEQTGSFRIIAEQIKTLREPRLMAKFDHRYQQPEIFQKNNISLLPTGRGEYVLGRFDIFHKTEKANGRIINFPCESRFESFDFNEITSESSSIICASILGILNNFTGDELVQTVSGRMGSGSFDFRVASNEGRENLISVNKAQIEIDAGFEGHETFLLIEAKNYFAEDFVIRQLYYPYRKWQKVIRKKVRNLFLTYSDGIFDLREYAFDDVECYNSIRLINHRRYAVSNFKINAQSIQEIIAGTFLEPEPAEIPFPQADSFERVVNLCELLSMKDSLNKNDITESYGFDKRQTDYYTNACLYLGLVEYTSPDFKLSYDAKKFFDQHIQLRHKFLVGQLVKRKVFRDALSFCLKNGGAPTREQIVNIMRSARLPGINSDETFNRRASTVRAWVDWVVAQIED